MTALPGIEEWNRAVRHSQEHPAHILGPYEDIDGNTQIDCSEGDFDTGRKRAIHLDMGCRGGDHAGCIGPPGTRCECRCHAGGS